MSSSTSAPACVQLAAKVHAVFIAAVYFSIDASNVKVMSSVMKNIGTALGKYIILELLHLFSYPISQADTKTNKQKNSTKTSLHCN